MIKIDATHSWALEHLVTAQGWLKSIRTIMHPLMTLFSCLELASA